MHEEEVKQAKADREVEPWSAEQANAWRARTPAMSPWLPVGMQAIVAVLLLSGGMVLDLDRTVRLSVMWGVFASLLPSLLCVSGYRATMWLLKGLPHAVQALMGFVSILCWELVKLLLSVALLVVASRVVPNLHWLAMLLAFVVVVKAYWLALLMARLRKSGSTQAVLKTSV